MTTNRKLMVVKYAGDSDQAKVVVGAAVEVGALSGSNKAVIAGLAIAGAGFGLIFSGGSALLAGAGLLAGGAIGYGLSRNTGA
jgi:hypothetical protein